MATENSFPVKNILIINAMKLVCHVSTDKQLAEIFGISTGSAVTNAKGGKIPREWFSKIEERTGASEQAILRLVDFAEHPGEIVATQNNYDAGMKALFTEIKTWWATTEDPTVHGFALAFAESFPLFKKWRQDRIDIKNVEERGPVVEITETA